MAPDPDRVVPRRKILLATGNADKQRMLGWLLEGLPVHPVTPAQLRLSVDPDESGPTHESIARAKAEEWSRAAGIPAIASDGGLLVPALGANWESRHTHRFSGPAADDRERQQRLLSLLEPFSGDDRRAAFVEGLAIAEQGSAVVSWEVSGATGSILDAAPDADAASGQDGFWVFPLWHFPQYGRTYDQLTEPEKAAMGDHWDTLRSLVREFLPGWLAS